MGKEKSFKIFTFLSKGNRRDNSIDQVLIFCMNYNNDNSLNQDFSLTLKSLKVHKFY